MTASFDGPLVPQAFCPRTRTKYVPRPTPVATNAGLELPKSLTRMSVPPELDPASMTYDVGDPVEAVH